MRALVCLSLVLLLLPACYRVPEGTAVLNVTPVDSGAEQVDDSSFEVTVTNGTWSETQTAPLGGEVSFEVPAGEEHILAEGSWSHNGGDTGGEGCDCHGTQTVHVEDGDVLDVTLELACRDCWVD